MNDIPTAAIAAAESAIRREFRVELDRPGMPEPDALARAALEAAAPLLERSIRRKMAREILYLHYVDGQCSRNAGPWGSMDISLKRIERGEPLPGWRELHGGEGAGHG